MSTNEQQPAHGDSADRIEFDRLCRALTEGPEPAVRSAIEQRLAELVAEDPSRRDQVAGLSATLSAMAAERELFATCVAPVEASECADEEFAAAARGAVAAERAIRASLQQDGSLAEVRSELVERASAGKPAGRVHRGWFAPRDWFVAAATAAAVVLVGWSLSNRGPSMSSAPPGHEVLGPRLVVVTPQLGADARALSWSAVPGAAAYDAAIVDAAGNVVLERAAVHGANTQWQISQDELGALRRQGPVRLRVRALDSLGLPFATSGDLRLDVR